MQNLEAKVSTISTIPCAQKSHYSGGTTNMSVPVKIADSANIIIPMSLLPVL